MLQFILLILKKSWKFRCTHTELLNQHPYVGLAGLKHTLNIISELTQALPTLLRRQTHNSQQNSNWTLVLHNTYKEEVVLLRVWHLARGVPQDFGC